MIAGCSLGEIMKFLIIISLLVFGSMAKSAEDNLRRYLPEALLMKQYDLRMKDGRLQLTQGNGYQNKTVDSGVITVIHDELSYGASVQTCTKNRTKQCLGVFDYVNGVKNKYSLTQFGAKDDITRSICNIEYDKTKKSINGNPVQSLTGCITLSKAACDKWSAYKGTDSYKKFIETAATKQRECNAFFENLSGVTRSFRNIFQIESNTLEEVRKNFDKFSTNDLNLFGPNAQAHALRPPPVGFMRDLADMEDGGAECQRAENKKLFLGASEYMRMKNQDYRAVDSDKIVQPMRQGSR